MLKRWFSLTVCGLALSAATPTNAQTPAVAQARPSNEAAAKANAAAAVPADYVIGAEDVIGVVFWREAEMSSDVIVRPDGKVTLPLIGEMLAVGLTPDTLKTQIQTAATKYLSDANVTVIVRQINSRKVFITGQVGQPGAFPLSSPRTVMQLIALAGGLTEYADGEHVTVMRGARIFKFNYKDVAKGKNLDQNVQLQPGDTVVVP